MRLLAAVALMLAQVGAPRALAQRMGTAPMLAPRATAPPAGQGSSGESPAVQMGIVVRPDTVTVGDHFDLLVRVHAPRGASIGFPVGPDSGMSIEAVDPRTERANADTAGVDRTAMYKLVAWDTGAQTITIGDVAVTLGPTTRRIPVTGASVYVRSVLPKDTTLQVPKPARDVLAATPPLWPWIVAGLLALLLLLLLLFWLLRRRRRRGDAGAVDPYVEAEREFARIEALSLLEAGERGRYVALMVDVLRDYLAARLREAHRSLTTSELLPALRGRHVVPLERLSPVLAESDLVKFARRRVTTDRAREIGREAHAIVQAVERAVVEEQAAAARASEAAAPGEERAA